MQRMLFRSLLWLACPMRGWYPDDRVTLRGCDDGLIFTATGAARDAAAGGW